MRVPGVARRSLQESKLLPQGNENLVPFEDREGKIDGFKKARDGAALPLGDLRNGAKRACTRETGLTLGHLSCR